MLKYLFGRNKNQGKNFGPAEPIYPGENFLVRQIETQEGIGFVIVNQAYDNYPNKKHFPWCAQFLLEFKDKNENGHPTDQEAEVLNKLEDKIENFLKVKHKVHFIGRVTRKDFRDLIFYIDQPRLDQDETKSFFDQINAIRGVNFNLDKDPEWKFVSGLIK
ncbi:DUF695 domain-containing protein [Roseivirga sp. BDSF3-8]|uniref:DUF695 domain-containing protein n=1 Tax=Roseivirga sp. BDSF3-8 TaxID=3241598 RepID=UPI0035324951